MTFNHVSNHLASRDSSTGCAKSLRVVRKTFINEYYLSFWVSTCDII